MNDNESITLWLEQLKDDDSLAVQHLWEAFFQKMVNIARQHLPREKRQVADEEDVALSAFKSFCLGAQNGRFQHLISRDSLWPFLVGMTIHKAKDQARFVQREKRGGKAKHEALWENIVSQEPTPEFTVQLAEQLEQLLAKLDSTGIKDIRAVALGYLDGYSAAEIAAKLDCSTRSVERKRNSIERIWQAENCETP